MIDVISTEKPTWSPRLKQVKPVTLLVVGLSLCFLPAVLGKQEVTPEQEEELKNNGACVDVNNSTQVAGMCGFEIGRGAKVNQDSGATTKSMLDLCIEFDGFKRGAEECRKVYCFDLRHSTTFWVIVIGIPFSIIVAIIAICWLCCHFAYYMCCCCIFHMEIPAMFSKGKKPDSNQVAPAKSTATGKTAGSTVTPSKAAPSEPPKEPPKDATENAKDKEKKNEDGGGSGGGGGTGEKKE